MVYIFCRVWKIRATYDRYYVRNELLIGSAWFIFMAVIQIIAWLLIDDNQLLYKVIFSTTTILLCFGVILADTAWVFHEHRSSVSRANTYKQLTAQLELINTRSMSVPDSPEMTSMSAASSNNTATEHDDLLSLNELDSISAYGVSNSVFDFVGLYSVLSTSAGIHLFFSFLLNSQKYNINQLIV